MMHGGHGVAVAREIVAFEARVQLPLTTLVVDRFPLDCQVWYGCPLLTRDTMDNSKVEEKKKRGFAALTPERRIEIARSGGLAAHAKGKGHKFTTEEAREAGRKGARIAHERQQHRVPTGG